MENTLKNTFVWVLAFVLVGLGLVTTALAGPRRSDFALLDEETGAGDTSVQCGATKASSNNPKPVAFTMHITMTNRGDLGGVDGFVRGHIQGPGLRGLRDPRKYHSANHLGRRRNTRRR